MKVWICAMSIIVLFAFIFNTSSEKHKKYFLRISAVVLILLMGCRNAEMNFGTDLNNYYRLYERAMTMEWEPFLATVSMEKGYMLINYVLAHIVPWQQFILFAQAAFCIIVSLWFIYKNTESVQLATIFFVSFGPFQFFLSGFRQAIAICIGLIMFELAKEKKFIKYIVLLLLALSIHQTAIVLLPIYFLVNIKNTAINNIVVVLGAIIMTMFSRNFVDLGNEVFDRDYQGIHVGNRLGGLVPLLIYSLTLALSLLLINKVKASENKTFFGLIRMLIVGLAVYSMKFDALVLERVSLYFTPVSSSLLSNNIKKLFPNYIVYTVAIVLSVALYLWRVVTQYGAYTFFWR